MLGTIMEEDFYQCMKCLPELKVLKISDCVISLKVAQTIGKILSDFKGISELDLSNSGLD